MGNKNIRKKTSEPKHTQFILDIPMISLPLPPAILLGGGGSSQDFVADPGDAGITRVI
jgi:hypothetical protein